MTEPNSQPEKSEKERRYDPELLKKGLRCDLDQYEMLKRCSEKKDITEWNQWRIKFPTAEVLLQGALIDGFSLNGAFLNTGTFKDQSGTKRTFPGRVCLYCASLKKTRLKDAKLHMANLQNANLEGAKLQNAILWEAELQGANLRETCLKQANFMRSNLQGVEFGGANLEGADFSRTIVDGGTLIWRCKIDKKTKFEGVVLDAARIYPATKQLLEYNVRRMNWELWYK